MATNIDIYLDRFAEQEKRISAVEEHQRIVTRREIIQFVIGVVVIVGSIFGASSLQSQQNAQLIAQIEKRIDQLEKRIEQNERHADARIDDLRRDLTARFEDLKQVVLAQKK